MCVDASSDSNPEEERRQFIALTTGQKTDADAAKFAEKTKRKIEKQMKN